MIFILNKHEKVINFLKNGGDNTNPFYDDLLSEDLVTGAETFTFSTIARGNLSKDLTVGNYIAFKKDGKFKLFQISQITSVHEEEMEITVYCECAGLSLINKAYRARKIPSATFTKFLETVIEETDWSMGLIDVRLTDTLDLDLEDSTAYATLQNNLAKYNVEIEFRVEMTNGNVTKKYIDAYVERGKKTGKTFRFGSDIEGITKTVDSSNLCTALIGKGKDGLSFKDVVVEGINKPIGQDFVADQQAYELYNNKGYHLTGIFEFDTESPEELLVETYKQLQKVKEPQVTYDVQVALLGHLLDREWERVAIGDYIGIADMSFNPPLMLMARVSKLETSFTNPQNDKCTLTNFIEVSSNITDAMRKLASQIEGLVDSKFPVGSDDIQEGAINGSHMDDKYMTQVTADIVKATLVEAEKIVADKIEATEGRFETIITDKIEAVQGDIDIINSKVINTELLVADTIKANEITANKVTAIEGEFNTVRADVVKATEVVAEVVKSNEVIANKVDAVEGNFNSLNATVGNIQTVISGNISSENIQTGGITGDNLNMDTIFVEDANIINVNASKINTGEINTNKVTIQSENGGIVIADNTQQFKDKNGKVRVQIGQDAKGDFNFGVFDSTGTGVLIDATGVKEKALADGIIKDRMIGQGEIGGSKIDINSLITEVNKDTNTTSIKGSKILLDTEEQKLDVAFNSLKTQADDTKKKTESNTTQLGIEQGRINTLIQDTTIEKDGQSLKLKDEYSKLEQTVSGIKTTVGQQTTVITEIGNKIDNLEIGGRNILRNSNFIGITSFPYNGDGYNWRTASTSDGAVSRTIIDISDNTAFSGKIKGVKVSSTSANSLPCDIAQDNVKMVDGETYTMSCYAKLVSGVGRLRLQYGTNPYPVKICDLTTSWTKYSYTFTYNSSSFGNKLYTNIYFGFDKTNFVAHMCGFKLEKGNKATDWTPAPEDVETSIDNLTGKVTSVENKYSTLSQDLTGFKTTVGNTYSTKSELSTVDGKVTNLTSRVGTAESSITQLNDKIALKVEASDISNAVSNIQIGTRNLLLNSALKKTLSDSKISVRGTIHSVSIDTTNQYNGCNSLKVVATGAGNTSGQDVLWTSVLGTNGGSAYGKNLVFSFYGKATSNVSLKARLGYGSYRDYSKVDLTTSWKRYEIKVGEPTNSGINGEIIFYLLSAGTIYISNCKLEEGTKATNWTPAIEDIDSAIGSAQTNAINSAKEYTNGQITTVNKTITDKVAEINLTTEGITQRVSKTESTLTTHTTELGKVDNKISTAVNSGNLYVKGTGYNRSGNRIVQLNGTTIVNEGGRGFNLTVIKRSDLSVVSKKTYDVYGSDTPKNDLATALNNLNDSYIVVLTSYDAIATNDALDSALMRCGGSGKRFGGDFHRVPYALVGIPSFGKGSGIEVFTNLDATAPYAEINTKIVNGTPQGINTTSREVFSTISTTNNKVASIETNLNGITQRVSSTESTLKTTTTTANSALNKIDGLDVGGTNIIKGTNTISQIGSSGTWNNSTWRTASGGSGIREVINVSSAPNANIKKGIKITTTTTSSGNTDIAQDGVPVSNGTTYTLSCYARKISGDGYLRLQYGKSPYPATTTKVDSTSWKKYSFTFTVGSVSDGSTNGSTNIYFGLGTGYVGSVEICGFKLEKGNKATDWTPAPEDINSAITTVDSKVETTKNKVATIETNLSGITQRVQSTESTISTHTAQLGTVDSRIDTAKKSAISTASADATSKANSAQNSAVSSAKSYTDGQITTVNKTITDKVAEIKATTDSITSRVQTTETKTSNLEYTTVKKIINNFSISGNLNLWSAPSTTLANSTLVGKFANVTTSGNIMVSSEYAEIDPTKTYKVSIMVQNRSDDGTGSWYFGVYAYDKDKNNIGVYVGTSTTLNTNPYFHSEVKAKKSTVWRTFESYIYSHNTTINSNAPKGNCSNFMKFDANTKYLKIRFLHYRGATTYGDGSSGSMYFAHPTISEVDGAIVNTESRLKSAEQKITDSAIISTVQSTINTAKTEAINSANSSTDNKLKNYSTTTQMNTAISQSATSITNTVSSTYLSKTDASKTYATQSSLTQTQNSIVASFKSSGGYNLLRNSSGYNGTSNWAISGLSSAGTFTTTASIVTTGKGIYIDNGTKTTESFIYSSRFRLAPSRKYTLTGFFNTYTACPSFDVWLLSSTSLDETSTDITSYTSAQALISGQKTSGSWKKFSVTFTTPASTKSGVLRIDNNGYDSAYTTQNRVYFSSLILAEGDTEVPWSPHPNEVYDGNTTIDKNGVTVKNGGLTIKNNAGTTVFSGDSSGNLKLAGSITSSATISGGTIKGGTISGGSITGGTISGSTISGNTISGGTIKSATISSNTISGGTISGTSISGSTITGGIVKSTNGDLYFDMNNGYMVLYNNGTRIGQTNKNYISGTSIYGVTNGCEYGNYSSISAKTSSTASTYQMMLTATGCDLSGTNLKKGVNLGNTFHSNNWDFKMGNGTYIWWRQTGSNHDSFITEGSEGMLRLYGDNGMYLGYRVGDSNTYIIAIREAGNHTYPKSLSVFNEDKPATDDNGYSLEVNAPLNMKGQSINECSNIKTLGLEIVEPIAFNSTEGVQTRTLKVTKSTQDIVEFIGSATIKNGEATIDLPNNVLFKNYVVLLSPIGLDRKVSLAEKTDDNFKIVGDDGVVDYVIKFESVSYSKYISNSFNIDNNDNIIKKEEQKPKEIFLVN